MSKACPWDWKLGEDPPHPLEANRHLVLAHPIRTPSLENPLPMLLKKKKKEEKREKKASSPLRASAKAYLI